MNTKQQAETNRRYKNFSSLEGMLNKRKINMLWLLAEMTIQGWLPSLHFHSSLGHGYRALRALKSLWSIYQSTENNYLHNRLPVKVRFNRAFIPNFFRTIEICILFNKISFHAVRSTTSDLVLKNPVTGLQHIGKLKPWTFKYVIE